MPRYKGGAEKRECPCHAKQPNLNAKAKSNQKLKERGTSFITASPSSAKFGHTSSLRFNPLLSGAIGAAQPTSPYPASSYRIHCERDQKRAAGRLLEAVQEESRIRRATNLGRHSNLDIALSIALADSDEANWVVTLIIQGIPNQFPIIFQSLATNPLGPAPLHFHIVQHGH